MPPSSPIVRFGRFEVLSRIGIGGMGEVFHARLSGRGVEVALKLIRPEFADDHRYRDMFLAEAEIGRLLDHPNIARVVDGGEVEGVLYLATELVDGISLTGLTTGPVPPTVIDYVVRSLLDALAYVHQLVDAAGQPLGLVHRDVSPSNVLLSRAGIVKLTDFGVHKVAGMLRTQPGELKGKPAFMAPEQLPGGGSVDQRADLFAVGVILHMLAFGRAPFGDVGAWLVQGAPLDLDGPLADVIAHALAADPQRRVATAHDLADELSAVLPSDPNAPALLGQLVNERARPERPIGAIERLIMSELEPAPSSSLVYAPDPSTDRLWVVAESESNELRLRPGAPDLYDESDTVTTEAMMPRDPLRDKLRLPPIAGASRPPSLPPIASANRPPSLPPIASANRPPSLLPIAPLSSQSLSSSRAPRREAVPSALQPMPSAPVARIPLEPEARPRSRARAAASIAIVGGVTLGATVLGVQLFPAREVPLPAPTAESAPVNPAPEPTPEAPPEAPAPPLPAPPPPLGFEKRAPSPPPAPRAKPKPRVAVEPKPRVAVEPPDRPNGYLTLDTDPWATVYVGTRKLGTTPFMRAPLPAGRYKLLLDVKNSGERIERTVDIAPGEVKRLALKLH